MIDSFYPHPDFSLWLCLTLVHSLWIWAVIAVFVFVLDRLMKNTPVEKRYGSHIAALVTGLILLPVTFYFVQLQTGPTPSTAISEMSAGSMPERPLTPATTPGSRRFPPLNASVPVPDISQNQPLRPVTPLIGSPTSMRHSGFDWQRCLPWLVGGYLLGVVFMLMRLLRSMLAVNRLSGRATLLNEGPLATKLNSITTAWSLKLKPRIAQTEELIVPTVVGLFRPLILLPSSMLSGLTTAELELILTHELAHVRRWDMWVNLLQRLAETILFFNPGLWYVSRKISVLREFCCDEMTCSNQAQDQRSQRIHYASALLRVLELSQPHHSQAADLSSLAVSGASPSEVRRRVARLFGEPLPEPFRLSRGLIYVTLLLCVMLGSVIWASQSPSEETDRSLSEKKAAEAASSDSFQLQGNVEVIALGTYDTPEQRWWNLSGERLNSVPYQQQPRMIADNPGVTGRQIIYRIRNLPTGSSVRGALIRQAPATGKQRVSIMGSSPFQKDQRPFPPGIFGNVFSVKEKQNRANVRISVASGVWDTRINLPADNTFGDKGLTEATGSGTYHMQMAGPYQQQGKIVLIATHDNRDRQVRIIAVDKAGKEHRASQSANTSISQNSYFTYRAYFKNLKLEDLDHFEFQTRPYESVEIADVPLNPDEQVPVTTRKPRAKKVTERVEVSGIILLEDGSPAESKGLLLHKSPGIYGTVGYFTDTFRGRFPAGPLVLYYHPRQYAPVRLDVGSLKAGVPRNDLKIILKPGHTHRLKIQNEQGEPIPDATIVIHPTWGGSANGPNHPQQSDAQGNIQLVHLADTKYDVRVSAPGYEPRKSEQFPLKAEGESTITLRASQKTTGRILDEAGKPVAGATLYMKHLIDAEGRSRDLGFGTSKNAYWGKSITTTDNQGRFVLTELVTGAQYLFIIAAKDGRRAIVHDIQAGQNREIVLPPRHDLQVTIKGDLNQLPLRGKQRKVHLRQRVLFQTKGPNQYWELVGADFPIKATSEGGTAFFPGLAIDLHQTDAPQMIEVSLQYPLGLRKIVPIAAKGETHVEFDLAMSDSGQEQADASQAATKKISIVIARHMMLLDGRQPITWEELDHLFSQLKNPAEIQPAFYITSGAQATGQAVDLYNNRIRSLQQKFHFHGFSQGFLTPRSEARYDRLKTKADLKPDPAHKLSGQIVDLTGKPVAGAEVVLITPVPEPFAYKTYYLTLVQGRIRNPLEHVMTRSDQQGAFTLYPPAGKKYSLLALHPEQGFKFVDSELFENRNEIKLRAWSGLNVTLKAAAEQQQAESISLKTEVPARDGWPGVDINQNWSDLPKDAQKNRFDYRRVPPGSPTWIERTYPTPRGSILSIPDVSVSLLPEEVRTINLAPLSRQQEEQLERLLNRSRGKK